MTKYDDLKRDLRKPWTDVAHWQSLGANAADAIEALQADVAEAHAAAIEAAEGCVNMAIDDLYCSTSEVCSETESLEELAVDRIRTLHTDASRAYLAERDERIKREAREEALREAAEHIKKTQMTSPGYEQDDFGKGNDSAVVGCYHAITALIEKDHPHD